jgi:SAM-dependent methyltransferase
VSVGFERAHFERHWGEAPPLNPAEEDRLAAVCSLVPMDVGTMLDIGAGNGWLARRLAAERPLLRAVGVDFSVAAMGRFPGGGVVGSADALPFAPGAFDLVSCCDCLEHLPDPVFHATLAEIRRLRPRYVIINTPINERRNGWDRSTCRCPRCRGIFHRDHHVRQLTESEYAGLLEPDYRLVADARGGWDLRFLLRLPERLAGRIQWGYRDGLICPHCGNTDFPDSPWKARLRRGLTFLDYAVTRPFRRLLTRKSEYVARFQRHD